jgi:putative (di)nucleoside polyphosphate hydrolase
MLYEGRDADIDVATKDPEFTDWRWMALDQLTHYIVPFKQGIYAELVRRFTPLSERLKNGEL